MELEASGSCQGGQIDRWPRAGEMRWLPTLSVVDVALPFIVISDVVNDELLDHFEDLVDEKLF